MRKIDNYVDKPFVVGHVQYCLKKEIDNVSGGDRYYVADKKDDIIAKVENITTDGFTWFTVLLGVRFSSTLLFKNISKQLSH
ncbi:hypothetical protein SAMN05660461_5973 [Chitinophaga ginsengisegetis]|uniref:Uncharacterized protein n=1 Tax=Chitinophaga ginsengisegetis TaxID=393003 RepID=A0A1T5PBT2_9BACT|nr:hypothetical protein [Chitinophaga ginsengisegetis]SKD10073.1 hypothetical protein SAMN05660461_5973 [Chitinophaga ginsengisegetis]